MTEPERPRAAGDELASFVRSVRRRVFAQRLLRSVAVDVLIALSVVALLAVADRLLLPGLYSHAVAGAIAGLGLVVAVARTVIGQRVGAFEAAAVADQRLDLAERVSSACYAHESSRGGKPVLEDWERLIVADARRSIRGARVAEAFPVRPRRSSLWLAAPLAVWVAALLWIPILDPFGVGAARAEAEEVKERVSEREKKLDDELKELAKKAAEAKSPEVKKLLELLAKEAERRRQNQDPTNPAQGQGKAPEEQNAHRKALLEVARREDAIRKGLQRDDLKDLKKALEELKGLEAKNAELTRALQAALKDGNLQKASAELQRLTQKLADLARKKPGELTKEEREMLEKLRKELERLARNSPALARLSRGLQNMPSGMNPGQMMQNLDQLLKDLQSLDSLQNDQAMLDQALELVQLTKEDLAKLSQHKCPNCGKKIGKKGQKPGGT